MACAGPAAFQVPPYDHCPSLLPTLLQLLATEGEDTKAVKLLGPPAAARTRNLHPHGVLPSTPRGTQVPTPMPMCAHMPILCTCPCCAHAGMLGALEPLQYRAIIARAAAPRGGEGGAAEAPPLAAPDLYKEDAPRVTTEDGAAAPPLLPRPAASCCGLCHYTSGRSLYCIRVAASLTCGCSLMHHTRLQAAAGQSRRRPPRTATSTAARAA